MMNIPKIHGITGSATKSVNEYPENSTQNWFGDEIYELAIKSQPAILEDMLKAGIPLVYCDAQGNLMQKNPDGTTEPLHREEDR
jgi:hypothetical protein